MSDSNPNLLHQGEPGDFYHRERPAVSDEMRPEFAEFQKDQGATPSDRVYGAAWHATYSGRGIKEGGTDPITTIESKPGAQDALNAWAALEGVAAKDGTWASRLRTAVETASGRTLEDRINDILKEAEIEITATAVAGVEGTVAVERAFPEPALDAAASEKVRTLAAAWNLLPGSEIIRNLRVWRDTHDPAWFHGRGFAQRAAENPRGWETTYAPAFRDLYMNDTTPDGVGLSHEAREWSSRWGGVIRKRARNAMRDLEELADSYRRQGGE